MNRARRRFIRASGAISLGFLGLRRFVDVAEAAGVASQEPGVGYGDLIPDPEGILDLPAHFSYRVFSSTGERMDDGYFVPGKHDGMAAFPGRDGRTILVRNHEMNVTAEGGYGGPDGGGGSLARPIPEDRVYDTGQEGVVCPGGTTTLVYDTARQELVHSYLSLTGTLKNCAGGPTPWGSWITCEETDQKADSTATLDHGYNFEVPAVERGGLVEPVPLKAMGRFYHEAVAVDPRSGIVYQTEDKDDGLIYRFVPDVPGKLAAGGRLQALVLRDGGRTDTRNWDGRSLNRDQVLDVTWVDIEDVEAPTGTLRQQGRAKGATMFARGEGMWFGNNTVYIACTNGGPGQHGQIFTYTPSPYEATPEEDREPGKLQLFIEPDDQSLVDRADNLTVAPWGDVILCEDGSGVDFVSGVTPEGAIYKLGRNAMNHSEFAGVTFSPDGSTLFVNIQSPGLTLAVTGPWRS